MTPELRQSIVHARTGQYTLTMAVSIMAFVIIGGVLHLGGGAYSAPLMVVTLTTTAFGILVGGAALDDLANLQGDMTEDFKATGYGVGVAARDFSKLKMASSGLLGLTGLATVLAILL